MKKQTHFFLLFLALSVIGCTTPIDDIFICGASTIKDADGNIYHTLSIGNQCWTVENLKTGSYNDSAVIPNVTDGAAWAGLTTGAWCNYDNDAANDLTYGKLYNWYAVNTGKLAPRGWHVPSDAEWTILADSLGGDSIAGEKMKAVSSLWTPFTGIVNTNSSGFTALPGGDRYNPFTNINEYAYWWTSTERGASGDAWYRAVYHVGNDLYTNNYNKAYAMSIRCVKD